MQLQYGVDLITFYHPEFWGAKDRADFEQRAGSDPTGFWEKIAESVVTAGIIGVELTFPPGDWETAVRTYGSASAFADVMRGSGISVISGFFSALEAYENLDDPEVQDKVLDETVKYSAFLEEADGQASECLPDIRVIDGAAPSWPGTLAQVLDTPVRGVLLSAPTIVPTAEVEALAARAESASCCVVVAMPFAYDVTVGHGLSRLQEQPETLSIIDSIAAPWLDLIPTSPQKATRCEAGMAIGMQQQKLAMQISTMATLRCSPSTLSPDRGPA